MFFGFLNRRKRRTVDSATAGFIARRAATPSLRQEYDALRDDIHREPLVIRSDLTETEQMFYAEKRIRAYIQASNLYDNDNVGSTLDTAIRLAIGPSGGIPQFIGEGREQAQRTFSEWRRHAGHAEGENFSDLLALILRTVKLHGDCLIHLDPLLTHGRLRVYDADQICDIAGFDAWAAENGLDGCRQVEGVVIDEEGAVQGYFVTGRRNCHTVARSEATFLPIGCCRRVSYHRKVTQYRGEPLFLPNAEITADTRSLIKSEVQAARNAAEMSLVVEDAPGATDGRIKELLGGLDPADAAEGTGFTAEDIADLTAAAQTERTFDAFAGHSAIAHVPSGTKVTELNNAQRPSNAITGWMDQLADANGKRLGVMSCLARGRADNSYSSGQIELAISWSQFEEDQKLLERQVVDYVCGILCPGVDYVVSWPRQFEIDPDKAERTLDARLRGGRTTYRDLLGPTWRDQLAQLAEEKKLLEELGLGNLAFFQTASGATAAPEPETEETP